MINFIFDSFCRIHNIFSKIENCGVVNPKYDWEEINSFNKIVILDGDNLNIKFLRKYINDVKGLSNIKTFYVKQGDANKIVKRYHETNPNTFAVQELLRYTKKKEASDKYISLLISKLIMEGNRNFIIVSNDGDFVDVTRMIDRMYEGISITLCYTDINKSEYFENINIPLLNFKNVNVRIHKY